MTQESRLPLNKKTVNSDGKRISAARQQVHTKRCLKLNSCSKSSLDILGDLPNELPPGGNARPERLFQVQRNEDRRGHDRNPIHGNVGSHERLTLGNYERRQASIRILNLGWLFSAWRERDDQFDLVWHSVFLLPVAFWLYINIGFADGHFKLRPARAALESLLAS
jgi:hypothetical protein